MRMRCRKTETQTKVGVVVACTCRERRRQRGTAQVIVPTWDIASVCDRSPICRLVAAAPATRTPVAVTVPRATVAALVLEVA